MSWQPGWYGYHVDSDDHCAWGPEKTAAGAMLSCPSIHCDLCTQDDKRIGAFLITEHRDGVDPRKSL